MAKVDLNADTVDEFIGRIEKIQADSTRLWGKMTPERLLRHLTYTFQVSLEEVEPEKAFIPMPSIVTWWLFFEWFTEWPKGKIKAPDSFCPEPDGDVASERARCVDAARRFVAALEANPEKKAFTPLLGQLPLRKWARLHGVHVSHHLRQYGV